MLACINHFSYARPETLLKKIKGKNSELCFLQWIIYKSCVAHPCLFFLSNNCRTTKLFIIYCILFLYLQASSGLAFSAKHQSYTMVRASVTIACSPLPVYVATNATLAGTHYNNSNSTVLEYVGAEWDTAELVASWPRGFIASSIQLHPVAECCSWHVVLQNPRIFPTHHW